MNSAMRAAIGFLLVLGLLPVLLFALLTGAGDLTLLDGLIAGGICLSVALGFALMLGRDIVVLARLLRQLRQQPDSIPEKPAFLVPGMRHLGQEVILLLRADRQGRAKLRGDAAEDRALVERLPDPLLKLDAAGNVIWRNESAAHAFGQETAALLRHPDVRTALAEAGQRAAPVRKSIAMAVPVARDLDITIIPVGQPVYVLITDRTRERAVEKMRADFAANSSHELRTPLASLIGFIETLRGPAADDASAQQHFLGIMAEQAMRMQRLIEDLLSLSRIEISEHQPPDEILHLAPFLERIAAAMEPVAKTGHAHIELAIAEHLPAVSADADQLAQVFNNLLDNAIKYGKRGGEIMLAAAPASLDTRFDPHGVMISVADEGAGIAREHIPRLTERFYRIDKGRSRAVGGTGLGLAIVKHVVNRHRGRLVIDSVEGKGTVFLIWLPARQDK